MPAKNVALTIAYTAWNTASQAGQTGDSANHTLKVVVDGAEGAVTGSVTEVDSTNCPGEYKVTLTAGNMNGNAIKFCGKSSTSAVVIIPFPIFTDGGVLPVAAPGTANGLLTYGTGTAQLNPTGGALPDTAGTTTLLTRVPGTVQPQTGDAFARIGAAGAGLTAVVLATPPPTAAAIATAVLTDTGDNTTAGSPGKILAQLLGAFTGTTSVFTTASLVNAPTGGGGGGALPSNGLDSVVVETGVNARQALSMILAACSGTLSGAGTGTITIKGGNVSTTRIVALTDDSGNRTSVTLTTPA